MDIKDKKLIFLGDSITQGAFVPKLENMYHQLVAKALKATWAKNCGLSGTRIARQTKPSIDSSYDKDFNLRADDIIKQEGDIIFVFGGTNDYGHGDAPLGDKNDTTVYTFYGAINTLFNKLVNRYGKENVIIMTPMHRKDENNPLGEGNKEVAGEILSTYVDVIKEVANKFGLKIIDLFNIKELNPNIPEYDKYFADGLHPNELGHAHLAKILEQEIIKL